MRRWTACTFAPRVTQGVHVLPPSGASIYISQLQMHSCCEPVPIGVALTVGLSVMFTHPNVLPSADAGQANPGADRRARRRAQGGLAPAGGEARGAPLFGAVVGRVTGQIRGGRFEVDNATAWTSKNYHWNTRDGGFVGWGQRAWAVAGRLATPDGPAVRLTYTSKDGDMARLWSQRPNTGHAPGFKCSARPFSGSRQLAREVT